MQPAERRDLPEAAEVEKFIALMPEPEAALFRQGVRQRKIIADERSDDDQDQRPEQDIDAQFMMTRVAAVDYERKDTPGGQHGGSARPPPPPHRQAHEQGKKGTGRINIG